MKLTVHVEWPAGNEDIDIELDGTETPEEIERIAQDAFWNTCNYAYSIDGEPQ